MDNLWPYIIGALVSLASIFGFKLWSSRKKADTKRIDNYRENRIQELEREKEEFERKAREKASRRLKDLNEPLLEKAKNDFKSTSFVDYLKQRISNKRRD